MFSNILLSSTISLVEMPADGSMLSLPLRILLIAGSLLTIAFMLLRVRNAKLQIKDTISWMIFALVLLALSIFPRLAQWISELLGFMAPINFVYLFIIFILLIKLFSQSLRISQLDTRLQQLAQRQALNDKAKQDKTESEMTDR